MDPKRAAMMFADITGDEDYIPPNPSRSTVEAAGPSSVAPHLVQDESSEDDSGPTPKRQRLDERGKTVVVVDSDEEHAMIRPSQPLSVLSSQDFTSLQRASADELKLMLWQNAQVALFCHDNIDKVGRLPAIEGDLKEVKAEKAKLEEEKKILEEKLKSSDETIEQLREEIRLLQKETEEAVSELEVQKLAAMDAEAEAERWRGEVKAANNDGFNNGVKQAGFFNKDLPINLEHCRPWRFIDERGQLNEYRKGTPQIIKWPPSPQ